MARGSVRKRSFVKAGKRSSNGLLLGYDRVELLAAHCSAVEGSGRSQQLNTGRFIDIKFSDDLVP